MSEKNNLKLEYIIGDKGWGERFDNQKEIENKGWVFRAYEQYIPIVWKDDFKNVRRGILGIELVKTPGRTIAQKLYNDSEEKIEFIEKIRCEEEKLSRDYY